MFNRGDKNLSKKDSAIINEIDKARLKLSIEHYIKYFIGKRTREINKDEALEAVALAVREFAMDKMYETIARYNKVNTKRVYYLSIEYLIGRSLENNLHNLGLFNILKNIKIDGLPEDISLTEIFDAEYDPALGNGGLGRLAACYLDSMASLGIPGFGYGINYQFGLFKQKFENGYQIEQADTWLGEDSPWQFVRLDRKVAIPMYGEVETLKNASGQDSYIWMNTKTMYGVPFDFPIVGYDGKSVNYLRLFSAKTDVNLILISLMKAVILKPFAIRLKQKQFPRFYIRLTLWNPEKNCASNNSTSLFPALFRILFAALWKRATISARCRNKFAFS